MGTRFLLMPSIRFTFYPITLSNYSSLDIIDYYSIDHTHVTEKIYAVMTHENDHVNGILKFSCYFSMYD